jgi:hypothetical protein
VLERLHLDGKAAQAVVTASADFPLWTAVRVRLHTGYSKALLPLFRSEPMPSQRSARQQKTGREIQ